MIRLALHDGSTTHFTWGDLWADWLPAVLAFFFVLVVVEFALSFLHTATQTANEAAGDE